MNSECNKAIIVAAGRGRRLGENTAEIPKCMVRVNGQPILHWQLHAFAEAGIRDVAIVRGYLGDRIDAGDFPVRFVDNPEWASNNILASLMCAAAEFPSGFYFSYCDIVYAPSVVARLAATARDPAAATLVIDRRWADAYRGRTLHPVSEAELTAVESSGRTSESRVVQVGKGAVATNQAVGEFIGLAHFSPAGAAVLARTWQGALGMGGLDVPFGRAKTLRQAYLTDALNAMARAGERLAPVFIDGEWREIDTQQDLAAAEQAANLWTR
jgi:L-glutamine-phosphate cytidylyltransferase